MKSVHVDVVRDSNYGCVSRVVKWEAVGDEISLDREQVYGVSV